MYEVLGYNLFTTALFTVTSIKDIPNTFDVKHFKPKSSMDITGAYIDNENPTSQMIEQIRRARAEITIAQYKPMSSIYAYYKNRLF